MREKENLVKTWILVHVAVFQHLVLHHTCPRACDNFVSFLLRIPLLQQTTKQVDQGNALWHGTLVKLFDLWYQA